MRTFCIVGMSPTMLVKLATSAESAALAIVATQKEVAKVVWTSSVSNSVGDENVADDLKCSFKDKRIFKSMKQIFERNVYPPAKSGLAPIRRTSQSALECPNTRRFLSVNCATDAISSDCIAATVARDAIATMNIIFFSKVPNRQV